MPTIPNMDGLPGMADASAQYTPIAQDYAQRHPARVSESCAKNEERALRLMYELRAQPPPNQMVWVGEPYGWVKNGAPTRNEWPLIGNGADFKASC